MYEIFQNLLNLNGLKVSDVSKATGIRGSTFTDWKKGRSRPKLEKMEKIARYFGVPVDYLMGLEKSLDDSHDPVCALIRNNPELASVLKDLAGKGYTVGDLKLAIDMLDMARGKNV